MLALADTLRYVGRCGGDAEKYILKNNALVKCVIGPLCEYNTLHNIT